MAATAPNYEQNRDFGSNERGAVVCGRSRRRSALFRPLCGSTMVDVDGVRACAASFCLAVLRVWHSAARRGSVRGRSLARIPRPPIGAPARARSSVLLCGRWSTPWTHSHDAPACGSTQCLERALKGELLGEHEIKEICNRVRELLVYESNVVHIKAPCTVVGDVHG